MRSIIRNILNFILLFILPFLIFSLDNGGKLKKNDFVYHSFEEKTDFFTWNGEISLSEEGDPVFQGKNSLKVISYDNWGTCGIQAECGEWNVDIDPSRKNNQFVLWVYAEPENKGDNNLNIQFYDLGMHSKDDNKVEYWTEEKAIYGKWTKIVIPFFKLKETLDIHHINKIQIQQYWPGTYYYDFMIITSGPVPVPEGIYQTFENRNAVGWAWEKERDAFALSDKKDPFFEGNHSLKFEIKKERNSDGPYWAGCGIQSENMSWKTDLNPGGKYDRFTFWVYALPVTKEDNSLKVYFYDNDKHRTDETRAEYLTKEKAVYGKWTKISVPYSKLPKTLDLHNINNIQVSVYKPGVYYIDSMSAAKSSALVYHSFENASDIWQWAEGGKVERTSEVVFNGKKALKLYVPDYKQDGEINASGGTGIQAENMSWTLDFSPEINDCLVFWINARPMSGFDTNFGVEFFDHGNHFEKPVAIWTAQNAVYGKWTKIVIPFDQLPKTLDLNRINKIQFVAYWPGTYYFDDFIITKSITPRWQRFELGDTTLRWKEIDGVDKYVLEEAGSRDSKKWNVVYSGKKTFYEITNIRRAFYRVRGVDDSITSDPSEIIEYNPPAVLLKKSSLDNGRLEWTTLSSADIYEVQKGGNGKDSWKTIYKGAYPKKFLSASENIWYRVRALKKGSKEAGNWSPALCNATDPLKSNFLKTDGRIVRNGYGKGERIISRGVNLGSWLLLETWMSSMGGADNPVLPDDWSVRQTLKKRFGEKRCNELLEIFQDTWIKEGDLDIIMNMGLNIMRLPIYYLNLQDEKGNWKLNEKGEIDFSRIDWLVNAAADRGLYVILDLHGTPGCQNKEHHSGRSGFNKLFVQNGTGEKYRKETIAFWEELAKHYKDNPTVAGYDLLNEPTGILDKYTKEEMQNLYSLYDRIYRAIRAIDPDHIIILEAMWHWQDMCHPSVFGWENVVYSFHYYGPGGKDTANPKAQKKFYDRLVEQEQEFSGFNVPMQLGEFSPMAAKESWRYFLDLANRVKWDWIFWAYKTTSQSSTWGFFNGNEGTDYKNPATPKIREDSFEVLSEKLRHYDTISDFHPYTCLKEMIEDAVK